MRINHRCSLFDARCVVPYASRIHYTPTPYTLYAAKHEPQHKSQIERTHIRLVSCGIAFVLQLLLLIATQNSANKLPGWYLAPSSVGTQLHPVVQCHAGRNTKKGWLKRWCCRSVRWTYFGNNSTTHETSETPVRVFFLLFERWRLRRQNKAQINKYGPTCHHVQHIQPTLVRTHKITSAVINSTQHDARGASTP